MQTKVMQTKVMELFQVADCVRLTGKGLYPLQLDKLKQIGIHVTNGFIWKAELVVLDGVESSLLYQVISGVPQGSTLGRPYIVFLTRLSTVCH